MKGAGADFAWALMQQQGWKQGDGLGARKQGMKDAIKPKLKFDHSGMGHNRKEEFEFHWWDHVFNSAAKGISVDESKGEVTVEFKTDKSEVSTKKLRRKMQKEIRSKLYSHFVKAATLKGGDLVEEKHAECLVEEVKDMSRTLSDDELVKACGGRTAHKGARHGQRMTAKLQRVADAEKLYLEQLLEKQRQKEAAKNAGKNDAKNPGKNVVDINHGNNVDINPGTEVKDSADSKDSVEGCKDDVTETVVKKKKKSKHKEVEVAEEEGEVKIKKKKKKLKHNHEENPNGDKENVSMNNDHVIPNPAGEETSSQSEQPTTKKKKKKRSRLEAETATASLTDSEPKAKKKKRKESRNEVCDNTPTHICNPQLEGELLPKKKRKKSKKAS